MKTRPYRFVSWTTLAAGLLAAYWLLLVTGTHLPSHSMGPARYNDKLAHLTGYAGLAFLLSWAWTTRRPLRPVGAWLVWGICVLHGALDELTQIPVPGRSGEFGDWFADSGGAAIGLACFCTIWLVYRRLLRTTPLEPAGDIQ